MGADEVEPGSVMLFFLLLSAFIAVLALRAHLLSLADSAVAAAVPAPTASPPNQCCSRLLSDGFPASSLSPLAVPTPQAVIALRVGGRLIRSVSLAATDVSRP